MVKTGVANINLQNKAGYTPIMLAALCDVNTEEERKALRLLLHKGDVNISASQVSKILREKIISDYL